MAIVIGTQSVGIDYGRTGVRLRGSNASPDYDYDYDYEHDYEHEHDGDGDPCLAPFLAA